MFLVSDLHLVSPPSQRIDWCNAMPLLIEFAAPKMKSEATPLASFHSMRPCAHMPTYPSPMSKFPWLLHIVKFEYFQLTVGGATYGKSFFRVLLANGKSYEQKLQKTPHPLSWGSLYPMSTFSTSSRWRQLREIHFSCFF